MPLRSLAVKGERVASAMAEPEPEVPAVAGALDVLALRWTGISVKSARKRDVLRWCRVHCSPTFLVAQNLAGAGSVDGIAKSRSAAELHAAYAAAIEPGSQGLRPKPRLLYYFQASERERDEMSTTEDQGQCDQLLLAELEATGWKRTTRPSEAALLLGEKPGSEARAPRVLPGSADEALVNRAKRLRDSGDTAHGQQGYIEAIEQYSSALALLQPIETAGSSEGVCVLDPPLGAVILVNRSLCWSAQAKVLLGGANARSATVPSKAHAAMTSAVEDALAAMAMKPSWARGHYRHGLALWAMHYNQWQHSCASSDEARLACAGLAAAYSSVEHAHRLQNIVTFAKKKKQLKQKLEELGVPVPRRTCAAGLGFHREGPGSTHTAKTAPASTAIESLQWLETLRQASHKDELYAHLLAAATMSISRNRRGNSRQNKRAHDASECRSACACGCGADGLCADVCDQLKFLPPTAIVRTTHEVASQLDGLSAQQYRIKSKPTTGEGNASGWFVKHPHGGGGTGTIFAPDVQSVEDAVSEVLGGSSGAGHSSCAVVQRAVSTCSQATLPKGPSRLELRVHVLFRRRVAWVFSGMRVKTAALKGGSALNNKKVQQACKETWGAFYPNNSLDAAQLEAEGALPTGTFERVTRPQIYAAIATTHGAVCEHIEDQGFLWFGADFLVGKDGTPTMLELNVKPCSRFLHQGQFESPVALRMARAAVRGLIAMLTAELVGVQELVQAHEAELPEQESHLKWVAVAGDWGATSQQRTVICE